MYVHPDGHVYVPLPPGGSGGGGGYCMLAESPGYAARAFASIIADDRAPDARATINNTTCLVGTSRLC